ncbi:MAG: site-specific tyrosine recombinase, partial [Acidimicrobiales bacterium]
AVSPAAVSPAAVSPGTVSPAAVSPGTVSPGTVSPGTVSPGTVSPGTVSPAVGAVERQALSSHAEEYLSWLAVEKGRASNTIAAYRRDLVAYEGWLETESLALESTAADAVARYLAWLQGAGLQPASVARGMAAVRGLHRFCLDEGRLEGDPTADLGLPPVPRGLPKALSEAEIGALLDAVVGDDPCARRDRAILEVLYGAGLRVSELVGLCLDSLILPEGIMRVMGKGAKERVVPVGRCAGIALEAWLDPAGRPAMAPSRWARRGDAEAVFLNVRGGRLSRQSAWGIVCHYGKAVGLEGRLTPHVLRHSCATHMLDHGADIRVVQELLGHASVATTQVYTKVSTARLRAAYTAAHPRAAKRPGSLDGGWSK